MLDLDIEQYHLGKFPLRMEAWRLPDYIKFECFTVHDGYDHEHLYELPPEAAMDDIRAAIHQSFIDQHRHGKYPRGLDMTIDGRLPNLRVVRKGGVQKLK